MSYYIVPFLLASLYTNNPKIYNEYTRGQFPRWGKFLLFFRSLEATLEGQLALMLSASLLAPSAPHTTMNPSITLFKSQDTDNAKKSAKNLAKNPVIPKQSKLMLAKEKPFRISARNLFLTFPNVTEPFTLEDVRDSLVAQEERRGLKYACIGTEPHKDGTPHFHLLLHYDLKRQITNSEYFNFLFNKQGNYQGARDLLHSIQYVKKHGNFIEWGTSPLLRGQETISKILNALERPNAPVYDVYEDMDENDRAFVFEKANKIESYHRRFQGYLQLLELRAMPRIVDIDIPAIKKLPIFHKTHLPI